MADFATPLLGGILIGLAALVLMAVNGRIAGISGILGGLLFPSPAPDRAWRLAFLAGLVAGPFLAASLAGRDLVAAPVVSLGMLATGGLLVGIGTTLGGGCTSGHGVCGMARLSPRSLVATAAFMATGFAAVFVARHLV